MKYFKFLFLAIFVSIALVSCGDDSNPTNNDDINDCRPTSITVYDSLTNQKLGGRLFSYNGKLLTSIDYLDAQDAIIETIMFEYDGDKLIKKTSSRYATTATFEYSTDGKLETRFDTKEEDENIYTNRAEFIYDAGNISKVELYYYHDGYWEIEPAIRYEYLYNASNQLIKSTFLYKDYDSEVWDICDNDTFLYSNNKVVQYNNWYGDSDYIHYFLAYDSDSRLNKVSIESDKYPLFVCLSFRYNKNNTMTLLFKEDYDDATVKMEVALEKQESNVFEVSKLLMLEEPSSIISDYLNLLVAFMNN